MADGIEEHPPHRAPARKSQIERLQRLIEWLRSGRRLTATLAAAAMDVSVRTIATDIRHLAELGVRLEFDRRERTYRLMEPVENLPLIPMQRADLAAFLVASHALHAFGDTPRAHVLRQAVRKLADALPETVHVDAHELTQTIRFDPGSRPRAELVHLSALDAAALERRLVRIRYWSNSRDEETVRDVEPYTLLARRGLWYLIGYCRLRKEMRDFRIDRIRSLDVRPEVCIPAADFDLNAYLGPAFGMVRGERTCAVHVRFTPYQARWVQEEIWHESQVMIRRADGSLDLHMQVAGLSDVARWALSYGAECEVLSPPDLRHLVAGEARRMAEMYRTEPPVDTGQPTGASTDRP
jgi:predicted DNA-binding transcriptional regulator YafY